MTMRLLVGLGCILMVVLLGLPARHAVAGPGANDPAAPAPSTGPTPNPAPNWPYYDLGPFDDAAYRTVTIAEIVADPFQFDGQLVRVRGQYRFGARPMPDCVMRPASRPPTTEPGFIPDGGMAALTDASGELGVQVWGKNGDGFASQDELATAPGEEIELRGIVRASYKSPPCNAEQQFASAYLAIQRTDPAIPFKLAAQDIGRKLTALPPGSIQDEVPPTTTPIP
jgi:hypothetical protein